MNLFNCNGCASKEAEIQFLREQNKRLTDTLTEFADSSVAARIASRRGEVPPRPEEKLKPVMWRGERIQEPPKVS